MEGRRVVERKCGLGAKAEVTIPGPNLIIDREVFQAADGAGNGISIRVGGVGGADVGGERDVAAHARQSLYHAVITATSLQVDQVGHGAALEGRLYLVGFGEVGGFHAIRIGEGVQAIRDGLQTPEPGVGTELSVKEVEQAVGGVGEIAVVGVRIGTVVNAGGGVAQFQRVGAQVLGNYTGVSITSEAVVGVGFEGGHGLSRYEYVAVSVEVVVRHQYPPVVGEIATGVISGHSKGDGEVVGIRRVTVDVGLGTAAAAVGLQVAKDRAAVLVTAELHDHAGVVAGSRELEGGAHRMLPVSPSVSTGGRGGALDRQSAGGHARVSEAAGREKRIGTEDAAAVGELGGRCAGGGKQQWITAVPGIELRHGSDVERVGVARSRRGDAVVVGAPPGAVWMRSKARIKSECLVGIARRSGNGGKGHGGCNRRGEVIVKINDRIRRGHLGLFSHRHCVGAVPGFTAAACGECNNGQNQDRKFHQVVHGEVLFIRSIVTRKIKGGYHLQGKKICGLGAVLYAARNVNETLYHAGGGGGKFFLVTFWLNLLYFFPYV